MTTSTIVRKLTGDEALEAAYSLAAYAFHASPPLTDKEEWMGIVRPRLGVSHFVLFEGDRARSAAAFTTMNQQVHGKLFPAHGVWDVATEVSARRLSYCRQVMTELLRDSHQSGHVFSCLYPFRESFYERLGYVTFPMFRIASLTPAGLTPVLKMNLDGEVQIELIGDGYPDYRAYLERMQARTHGMALFAEGDAAGASRNRSWLAKATVDGELVGIMLYHLKGDEIMKFLLRAFRFYYENPPGRYLLLQWLARHVDQAEKIEIWLPPTETPETWLADTGVKSDSAFRAPMGRVIDVARLNGMQTGEGEFCAQVNDPLCPWNVGVWRFTSTGGLLHVEPGGQAQFRLTIQGLSALVYGTHNPADFPFRGWGDPDASQQVTLRTIFPPMQPYLHEMF